MRSKAAATKPTSLTRTKVDGMAGEKPTVKMPEPLPFVKPDGHRTNGNVSHPYPRCTGITPTLSPRRKESMRQALYQETKVEPRSTDWKGSTFADKSVITMPPHLM
jgi:hypothetical protein